MLIKLETIKFFQAKDAVRGLLLKYFAFSIPKQTLEAVGSFTVSQGAIEIDAHEKKRTRVMQIIRNALGNLTCTITKNPAIYIDKASNVPLTGALEFGIIDRGTNILEIRPCSGCNLACTYCSVHEGPGGTKKREIVIDRLYLVEEFKRIAKIKQHPIEVYIETQGEPLLYAEMPQLISDLKQLDNVTYVTMVTNGTFLTEQRVDELAAAGLDRINWSINSLQKDRAEKIAGARYDVDRIKRLIQYAKDKLDILLCPVIMRGVNDDEMHEFVQFAKTVRKQEPMIGFQNFLFYKGGRNPVKELPMDDFNKKITKLEEQENTRLRLTVEDFNILPDNTLEKPFRKKQIIEVEPLFLGRLKNEFFCKSQGVIVKVIGKLPDKKHLRVQIIREKHGIFIGKLA